MVYAIGVTVALNYFVFVLRLLLLLCGFLPRPIYSCCFVPIVGVLDLSILMQPSLSCVYV